MFKVFLRTTVIALALLIPLPAFAASPTIIKVSTIGPETEPTALAIRQGFKKTLEERTNGRYRVDLYAGNSIGNIDTVFQGIQFGTLHMGVDTTSNLTQFAPEYAAFDMPYLLPGRAATQYLFASKLGDELRGYLDKRGART
ncbi:TRAP transporter substrate-binding protein DctP, partial [Desulfovibrio sp. OttesenSCG-928-C14]|nr:TRAP transporter substrate-binding protein DctP [Desulfovibrio sp. OttesenSCG-928-C14]